VPLTADSGAVVVRVLDFTRCSLEATFTGGNIDSVNIGDSAEIKVKRRSGQDITFDIRTPDTTLVARLFSLNPGEYDPFIDSLKSLYTGLEMTAREQGVYTVENAGAPGMIIEFTVRPSSRAGNPLVLNARPFTGVVEKGTRYLGVEVAKPFPDTTMRKLRRWVDAVITAKGLEIDGEPYAVDRINTVLVKLLPLNGSAPLDSYVSYKQRPKKMKQYAQKEFKVTATVRIDTVPPHVERLARSLYEESREYLKVEARINSYKTSWGKKLVKKR